MEDKIITITTFTNPHQFWILYKKNEDELKNLEKKLAEYNNGFKEINAQEGQVVIVYDHGTWKRAIVDKITEEKTKILCWLIDYGKSFITTFVYELPKQFTNQSAIAQPASLYKTIPLKNILDIETNKQIQEKQTVFNEGTLKIISNYIKKADKITFNVENVINNVLCGSLCITTGTRYFNLTDVLVKEKHVILDHDLYINVMRNNFQEIHRHTIAVIDNSCEIINKFPVSEGIGRGNSRQAMANLSGPDKSSYAVIKWLKESKLKPNETHTPVRRPLSSQSAVRPPSSQSAISTENRSPSKIELTNNSYEECDESSPKPCNRLKPSEKIINKSPSPDATEPKIETKIATRFTPSMMKMYQQKSADLEEKSNGENKFDDDDIDLIEIKKENVKLMNRFVKKVDFRTFLKGRGKSKTLLPKVGVESQPKQEEIDEDSWDDSCDSSQCSSIQMNTGKVPK